MPGTVLIVDDDAAMTDNLVDILGDEGYSPFCAGTCAEALALVEAHRPQIALLDLKLPDGTGINLLTRIKQIHRDCICALMTAYADLESAVAALEKGAFHYLQKPVRPAELLNLLARSLEIIQIREEKRTAEERLRESEERFRTIIESAQDAIFLKDSGLRYTLVNPVMEKLFGIDATNFIGRTNEELFDVNEAALTRPAEQRVLKGEIVEEDELWPISGKQRTFHSIKVPMTDRTGAVTGLCGFTRDMTLTRNLEAQLLQAQKMEAIGILAGGVSHDFNNLLQAILGYTQILMMGKSSTDPQLSKLREIERAARRATELTSQLLAFSRKAEIHPRPVSVNDVVHQVKKLLERTIPKMIDIQLRLTEPILTVNADPGQLEQVLLNIGVNARDAMPEGGCLTFETANVQPPHAFCQIHLDANIRDYVLLSVSDTGHGMSTEVLQHMFEPFFTTKQPGQGTGLGMAMAYGLIKNHHGHVTCESLPGQGTTFNIYLPAIEV
ncbi:MAG: response regulator, partial [Desulfatitalea sp.]|nr:response regulator [Desulfatitalea sp.]